MIWPDKIVINFFVYALSKCLLNLATTIVSRQMHRRTYITIIMARRVRMFFGLKLSLYLKDILRLYLSLATDLDKIKKLKKCEIMKEIVHQSL